MVRPITAVLAGVLVLAVCLSGCKSGSANADEVLSERTKQAESAQSSEDGGDKKEPTEEAPEDDGASTSVIRLFDENEVDDTEGGDIQIESASDDAVEFSVDTSSCKRFKSSMSASIDDLDTSCASDEDCTMLALPCDLGCGKPVAAYANLGQIEELSERYTAECPDCAKSCEKTRSMVAVCSQAGLCVAGVADDEPTDEPSDAPEDESDDASSAESE